MSDWKRKADSDSESESVIETSPSLTSPSGRIKKKPKRKEQRCVCRRSTSVSLESSSPAPSYDDKFTPHLSREQTATRSRAMSLQENYEEPTLYVHAWSSFFSRNALVTRIALQPEPDGFLSMAPGEINSVRHFYMNQGSIEDTVYQVTTTLGLDQPNFDHYIKLCCQLPEIAGEDELGPRWADLKKRIVALKLTLVKEKPSVKVWKLRGILPKFSKLNQEGTTGTLSLLAIAFQCDMQNGEAKDFFCKLSTFLATVMGVDDFLKVTTPVLYQNSNTKVELLSILDDINFKRGYTVARHYKPRELRRPDSEKRDPTWHVTDTSGHSYHKAKKEIPDVLWSTMETDEAKGEFLLVVEMKPDANINDAVFQCYKQLLCKMHFQTFGFGLVITPIRFVRIAACKVDDEIRLLDTSTTFLCTTDENFPYSFNIDHFTVLVRWLGRILKYAKTNMEKTDEPVGHLTKGTSQEKNN